jgi:hypothetical protein
LKVTSWIELIFIKYQSEDIKNMKKPTDNKYEEKSTDNKYELELNIRETR